MKTSILYASMPKLSSSYTQIPVFTAKPRARQRMPLVLIW